MEWNMAAECISVVFLIIIWFYSRKGNVVPTLRNHAFQCCFGVTFCAMLSNILSTVMIAHLTPISLFLTWGITAVYFMATPLMGVTYFCYSAATVYEKRNGSSLVMLLGSIPGLLYLSVVIFNFWNKSLFDITLDGYVRGPYIFLTYLIFYLYCILILVMLFLKRNWVEPSIMRILAIFPILACAVIIIQQIYPSIVLSGSAATSALLLLYLYLQNKQISIDYLTKIPNRQELLNMMTLRIERSAQHSFTVIVLSLRGFKQINDTYGQQVGDAFLQIIAEYLKRTAQAQEVYRFGGDEFAILIRENEYSKMEGLVLDLQSRMQLPWDYKEYSCMLQYAIGAVNYPESARDVEGLINGIEYAVSKAKQNTTDNLYYCGAELLKELRRKAQIIEVLREKLKENSFELYYQPIISTETLKFSWAESLLRIPESKLGPLSPAEFIPIAEETGMIIEMTYQILDKVCKFINRLSAEGIDLERIHVNFSAVQLTQVDLVSRMHSIIEENKTQFSKIKVEMTESTIAQNKSAVEDFAEAMHQYGVLLGLDDFGTGYSNIVSVMNTSFDVIKLDKGLVYSAMESERAAIMVRNLASIFQKMGISVLAEGVETDEQNQFVLDCAIDEIQGFFYAKPMPEEEAIHFLKQYQKGCGYSGGKIHPIE